MKILGFIKDTSQDKLEGTPYYRCFLPLREVHRHDNGIEAQILDGKELAALVKEVGPVDFDPLIDIFHWPRMSHGDCEEFAAEIHRRGALFVIDADDDLTETFKLVSGHGEDFKKVLGVVDYVTVTTEALANHLAQFTQRPPTVLKNHIDVDWFGEAGDKARRIVNGLTMGFTGSPTHHNDWYIPSVPFQKIVREFDIVPLLHGSPPQYLSFVAPADRAVVMGPVPYSLYPVILAQFDIVICAVDPEDPFNTGKSAIKALEVMTVNAIPICSPFGPYIELAADGAPIILVEEHTRDCWFEAMRDLLRDEELRLDLSSRGREWVKQNRDMNTIGYKHWESFYRRIHGEADGS